MASGATHNPPHLIMLIGLPGCGKSTLAAKMVLECSQRRLISSDAIRSQLFGDEAIQGPWLKVWLEIRNQFLQTVQQISVGEVSEAIYDATNAVRKQRRQAICLARACGFCSITGLWLHTPLWLCLERNQQRNRVVPPAVILQMHQRLVGAPPTLQDGFDRFIEITPVPTLLL